MELKLHRSRTFSPQQNKVNVLATASLNLCLQKFNPHSGLMSGISLPAVLPYCSWYMIHPVSGFFLIPNLENYQERGLPLKKTQNQALLRSIRLAIRLWNKVIWTLYLPIPAFSFQVWCNNLSKYTSPGCYRYFTYLKFHFQLTFSEPNAQAGENWHLQLISSHTKRFFELIFCFFFKNTW